jgi:hypothetical protein
MGFAFADFIEGQGACFLELSASGESAVDNDRVIKK